MSHNYKNENRLGKLPLASNIFDQFLKLYDTNKRIYIDSPTLQDISKPFAHNLIPKIQSFQDTNLVDNIGAIMVSFILEQNSSNKKI